MGPIQNPITCGVLYNTPKRIQSDPSELFEGSEVPDISRLWKALCRGVGVGGDDCECCSLEGRSFRILLKTPKRGVVPSITQEASGGTVLILGDTPDAPEGLCVEGVLEGSRMVFHSGVALFVKTSVSQLAFVNRFLVNAVIMLPKFLRDKILKRTGTVYDQETGSIESIIKLQWIEVEGNKVRKKFDVYNDHRTIPVREYFTEEVLQAWGEGTPLSVEADFKEVLRKAYKLKMDR